MTWAAVHVGLGVACGGCAGPSTAPHSQDSGSTEVIEESDADTDADTDVDSDVDWATAFETEVYACEGPVFISAGKARDDAIDDVTCAFRTSRPAFSAYLALGAIDLTGDGRPDLAANLSPGPARSEPEYAIWKGPIDSWAGETSWGEAMIWTVLPTLEAVDSNPSTLRAFPDIDGDGYAELGWHSALRGWDEEGQVFSWNHPIVVGGPFDGDSRESGDWLFGSCRYGLDCRGANGGSNSPIPAGDLNGDGNEDVALGLWTDPSNGEGPYGEFTAGGVYIWQGPHEAVNDLDDADSVLWGATEESFAGHWLGATGDLNGDGFDDLLVTSPRETADLTRGGVLQVVLGPTPSDMVLDDADARLWTDPTDEGLAFDIIELLPDLDGDGHPDLVHAGEGVNGYVNGTVALYHSAPLVDATTKDADLFVTGANDWDRTSWPVTGLGDLTGDGVPEWAVGTDETEDGVWLPVRSFYVIPGDLEDGTHVANDSFARVHHPGEWVQFAYELGHGGDLDGDGWDDVLVGSAQPPMDGAEAGGVYILSGAHLSELMLGHTSD